MSEVPNAMNQIEDPEPEPMINDLITTLKLINLDDSPFVNDACWKAASRLNAYKDLVEKVKEIIEGQMYPSHVEGGEGCEDDSYMGFGCSYCNQNKSLGEAIASIQDLEKKGS